MLRFTEHFLQCGPSPQFLRGIVVEAESFHWLSDQNESYSKGSSRTPHDFWRTKLVHPSCIDGRTAEINDETHHPNKSRNFSDKPRRTSNPQTGDYSTREKLSNTFPVQRDLRSTTCQ